MIQTPFDLIPYLHSQDDTRAPRGRDAGALMVR